RSDRAARDHGTRVDWETHRKSRTTAFARVAILDGDSAAELLDDAQRNGQTEPRAFSQGLRGEERLEDASHVSGRNSGSGILHHNGELALRHRCSKSNQPPSSGRLRRIDDQIRDDLLKPRRISISEYRGIG